MISGVRVLCPVCGEHFFSYANSFEICPVCEWENEEYQMNHPSEDEGANGISLVEYKRKWQSAKIGKRLRVV